MNNPNNPDTPQNPQKKPDFDKTFVEGTDAKTGYHSFDSKARVDATSLNASNPYGTKKIAPTTVYSPNDLPSGNEPLPLGSGTIVGLLGSGGMARVYKIWNEKLEVFRAVKILIPSQQGDLRNRFETEAKITAKLRHPNIVEIYSVGDWSGLPYLEMELIDGESLDAIIARFGKLPPSVCSAIAIFVARALSYAHNQDFLLYGKTYHGIIHRDLKPANIMISKHGDLRLMDFGIARPTEASLHTVDGNIVGTIQYLSPEQLDGTDIDCRADIYAFGAILYEMLTGTKTFPQDTITNLMKKKVMNDYRKFEEFDFSIPQGLAKISQKCLQLQKESRYANASLLLKDLESSHKLLTPDTPEIVLKKFLENPGSISGETKSGRPVWLSLKFVLPAAGAVVVALLIFVFLMTGPKPPEPQQKTTPAVQTQPVQSQPNPVAQNVQAKNPEPLRLLSPQSTQAQPPPASSPGPSSVQTSGRSSARSGTHARRVSPETPPVKETASRGPALERLKKTYGATDFLTIAQSALAKNAFDDAILACDNVPAASPQHEKAFLMQLDAYIQSDRLRQAKEQAQKEQINDAQYSLLFGELYQKMGRNKDAIENFQTALTRPSKYRNIRDVRNDALYYTALAYGELYKDDPSADNRGLAMQSWRVVKNMYSGNPENARFKKAVNELGNIK